jgi:hypothetical protein
MVYKPQQSESGGGSSEPGETSSPIVRKVTIIDPGFREFEETSVLRPRILGIKTPQDSKDLRNLKLMGIAFLVALLIFGGLEYKQLHESAREAKHSAMGLFNHQ